MSSESFCLLDSLRGVNSIGHELLCLLIMLLAAACHIVALNTINDGGWCHSDLNIFIIWSGVRFVNCVEGKIFSFCLLTLMDIVVDNQAVARTNFDILVSLRLIFSFLGGLSICDVFALCCLLGDNVS